MKTFLVPTGMADQYTLYPGTDFYGGDIVNPTGLFATGDFVYEHTVASCANMCLRTPGCIGFAFGSGGDVAAGDCWVKSGPWDVMPNAFRIAGRLNFDSTQENNHLSLLIEYISFAFHV